MLANYLVFVNNFNNTSKYKTLFLSLDKSPGLCFIFEACKFCRVMRSIFERDGFLSIYDATPEQIIFPFAWFFPAC